jgi:hypothetical protein
MYRMAIHQPQRMSQIRLRISLMIANYPNRRGAYQETAAHQPLGPACGPLS